MFVSHSVVYIVKEVTSFWEDRYMTHKEHRHADSRNFI